MTPRCRSLLVVLFLVAACKSPVEGSTDSATTTGTTTGTTTTSTTAGPTSPGTTAPTTSSGSSDTTPTGSGSDTASGTSTGSTGPVVTTGTTDNTSSDTDPGACVPKECLGKLYQCGDCIDNDDDGVVDAQDVECVNPCDDDEGSFSTGISGDNSDACKQDCFFDGNSGAGNDGCEWDLQCDPLSPGGDKCPYDPDAKCPPQDPMCMMVCKPPTGCDCFGCCSIYVDGMLHDVFLGDEDCSIKTFDQCTPCTKSEDCNPEDCHPELCKPCINQPLPPDCMDPSCPDGVDTCETNADCKNEGEYCDPGGCCYPIPQ